MTLSEAINEIDYNLGLNESNYNNGIVSYAVYQENLNYLLGQRKGLLYENQVAWNGKSSPESTKANLLELLNVFNPTPKALYQWGAIFRIAILIILIFVVIGIISGLLRG